MIGVTEGDNRIHHLFTSQRRDLLTSPPPLREYSAQHNRGKSIDEIPIEHTYVVGRGIDVKAEHAPKLHDFDYEDSCFQTIAEDSPRNRFVYLGPHLIDTILPVGFPGVAIPDTLGIDARQLNVWVLREIYEFKSGNKLTPYRKMEGFSRLLDMMREDDTFFPGMLQDAMPWVDFPDRIVVPPDHRVEVTFVSTHLKHGVVYDQNGPFKVSHLRISL